MPEHGRFPGSEGTGEVAATLAAAGEWGTQMGVWWWLGSAGNLANAGAFLSLGGWESPALFPVPAMLMEMGESGV